MGVDDPIDGWPVVVAAHDVVKGGVGLVAFLQDCTHCACVAVASGMVAMRPTVATHALQLCPQFLSTTAAATIATTIVLFVGECFCELGNSVVQYLQLQSHFVGFLLCAVANVGSHLILHFILGNRCCCNGGNVVPEFVAFVHLSDLIGTLVFAFLRSFTTVLLVDFKVLNYNME